MSQVSEQKQSTVQNCKVIACC